VKEVNCTSFQFGVESSLKMAVNNENCSTQTVMSNKLEKNFPTPRFETRLFGDNKLRE